MSRPRNSLGSLPEATAAEKRRLSTQIDRYFDRGQWVELERVLRKALEMYREDHWLIVRLADAAYAQRRYRTALRRYLKASALAPRCPLVRWGLAGASAACGDIPGAKRMFKSITRMKPEVLAKQDCGEGLRWARGLIADANYRLGQLAERERSKAVARRRYRTYLRWMERPAVSIESRRGALARLQALAAAS